MSVHCRKIDAFYSALLARVHAAMGYKIAQPGIISRQAHWSKIEIVERNPGRTIVDRACWLQLAQFLWDGDGADCLLGAFTSPEDVRLTPHCQCIDQCLALRIDPARMDGTGVYSQNEDALWRAVHLDNISYLLPKGKHTDHIDTSRPRTFARTSSSITASDALVARSRISTLPSDASLPATIWIGMPMRSASLNFTPARSSRSS